MTTDGESAPVSPWTVDSADVVVDDAWIRVRADSCRTAAGTVVAPYYVLEYPEWITVLAVTSSDEVLLVEQYRHGAATVTRELVAGSVASADASPLVAAQRELEQETGATGGSWTHLGSPWVNAATHSNRNHCFLAVGVVPGAGALEDPREVVRTISLSYHGFSEHLEGDGLMLPSLHLGCLHLARRWARRPGPAAEQEREAALRDFLVGGT